LAVRRLGLAQIIPALVLKQVTNLLPPRRLASHPIGGRIAGAQIGERTEVWEELPLEDVD
jgi:hypothetical protein